MSYTRQQYIDLLNELLPDNASQLISPQDLRTSLIALIDSIENFVIDDTLDTLNIGSEHVRNTRVGTLALDKIQQGIPGVSGEDNTALGYYALGGNYLADRNTAVGAYALGCNLYGNDNIAIGFNTIAGNVDGSGNVAVGNYALRANKFGDLNIAIGHGAGYYLGENYNYKLIIAADPVQLDDLCEVSVESGKAPLVYGDLKEYKFGIAVKDLHDYGTLQVSGDVTPSENQKFGLGNYYYSWNNAYISSGIAYSNDQNFVVSRYDSSSPYAHFKVATFANNGSIALGTAEPSGSQGLVTVNGHLVPAADSIYRLGHPDLKWDAVFNDIIVSGNAQVNNLTWNEITQCYYECKTLHLATSGICAGDIFNSTVCGYLSDEALDGAGFEVHSSGSNYRRDYRFIYKFPDQTLNCLEVDDNYSRSRWYSNISLELENGRHLTTQRIHSRDKLSLVSESGCYGLFIRPEELSVNEGNKVSFCEEADLSNIRGDFNVIYESGFKASFASKSSGVKPTIELVSRLDATVRGYAFTYSDNKDVDDNLAISAIGSNNKLVLNRLSGSGVFGVTNRSGDVYPATIFNVQSSGVADIRISSSGLNRSSVELLANGNNKASGVEFVYTPIAGIVPILDGDTNDNSSQTVFDLSLLLPSGETYSDLGALSIASNNYVAIGLTKRNGSRVFQPNAPLTIANNSASSGTISMHEQSSAPDATADYGKIYVKPYVFGSQTQAAYFLDDAGNEYNLVGNSLDTTSELVYGDANGNTYAGINCPASRPTASAYGNTAFGQSALYSITEARRNAIFGSGAGYSLTSGGDNVLIGTDVANKITTGSKNVIIGSENLYTSTASNCSNTILIGYRNSYQTASAPYNAIAIGTGLSPSNSGFLIGFAPSPLVSGSFANSSRNFTLKNAQFGIHGIYDEQQFTIENIQENSTHVTVLKVKDNNTSNYSPNFASLRFADENNFTRTLMDFTYNANPLNIVPAFSVASPARPYVSISGDLRILGAIRFADGTSIDDGNLDVALNFVNLPNAFDTPTTITTTNSYFAMSVPSGAGNYVGRITTQNLIDYIGSGYAKVSENCNHIWTNIGNNISVTNNSSSVFAGCNVAIQATGWKHSVMIGTEAGAYATTPNVGLATDTAGVFIGYYAGRNADNIANSIFIGTNAGSNAYAAQRSVFIGSNAGEYSSNKDSIGIGFNALRGEVSETEIGERNIEIVTGLLDNQRLLYSSGDLSDRINIQNSIAGNTAQKRISIGHATLDPTAVLTVRKNDIFSGHTTTDYIQDWWCNGNRVAAIDCEGNFIAGNEIDPSGTSNSVLEGRMNNTLSAPASPSAPVSGLFTIKNASWSSIGTQWVVNKDTTLEIPSGAFIVVNRVNGTYRPVWVSCSGVAS